MREEIKLTDNMRDYMMNTYKLNLAINKDRHHEHCKFIEYRLLQPVYLIGSKSDDGKYVYNSVASDPNILAERETQGQENNGILQKGLGQLGVMIFGSATVLYLVTKDRNRT